MDKATKLALVIVAGGIASGLLYGTVIEPRIEAHEETVEKQGFERGVAHAGRKCWYRGYFMDGDQRYDCVAKGNK